MISFEEVQKYLPKYLAPEAEKELFLELRGFPDNIDTRLYTTALREVPTVFQGDGIRDLLVVNLPEPEVKSATCMVISNTCDIDPSNKRGFHSSICYAPIFQLEKYRSMVSGKSLKSESALSQHIDSIKKQMVTQIFYLPQGPTLPYDGMVFLDRACHCHNTYVERSSVPGRRLFTLSDYGIWLFVLKLSIHFTRMTDRVQRMAS